MTKKVVVLPCSGIGKPTGEIGRQAAYTACRARPDGTGMACLGRLVIDDPEIISMVRDNFVITLDGCPDDCARKNVERFGKSVDSSIHVADLLERYPDLQPQGILKLGDDGRKLVKLLSEQIAAEIDKLIGEEG